MQGQSGFTLIELAISTVVLLVGVVAVMQLVPEAMRANLRNRQDTTAAVVAQRFRDLMGRQGIKDTTIFDPTREFPCGAPSLAGDPAVTCNFGDETRSDQVVGATLRRVVTPSGRVADVQIDFTGPVENGYRFLYTDADNPLRYRYEVRWAVVTSVRNVGNLANEIVSKRVVIGVRREGDPSQSVYFNTLLTR
jgi:prepilin-type N-terminal cleavage/methylation domain-containing protein